MTMTAAPIDGPRVRAPTKLQPLPGLDGLRAIAVVAVIVYHLNPRWLRGGFLGVDVFFVISGYLITSLLLAEWRGSAAIRLGSFWQRRARRLLPALLAMLVIVTVLAGLFARDSLSRLQGDLPAALAYVLNWHLLVQHQPYVASMGRPPLLLHLWSLSVEEQFYLVWPLAFIVLRKRMAGGRMAAVCLGGAFVSAALMAVFFRSSNPSAVYFGTESHAQGLLIGCALAAAVPPWRMSAGIPVSARRVLERSGLAALAVVGIGLATLGFYSAVTYRGGLLAIDLASGVLVLTVAHPATRLGLVLAKQPLRWIGLRSYSLYLWHWPIFMLTRPGVDLAATGWSVLLLRLGLTAGAAELSYRYIEQPWRTGRAQELVRSWSSASRPVSRWVVVGLPAVTVIVLLASAPPVSGPRILLQGSTPAAKAVLTGQAATTATVSTAAGRLFPRPRPAPPVPPAEPRRARATTTALPEPILAIGDSVLLAASPALAQTFGAQITVDAQVGRQVADGLNRLAQYRAVGALGHYRTVLIALGTNGAFQPYQFAQLLQLVKGVPRVVLVDVHADRPWAVASNTTIAIGVYTNANQMRIVDWNRAATPPLLYSDGIHPDAAGAAVYSSLVIAAVRQP
jgi:peptidoglycan/LPS O-acetylase OafA/YrhL